MQSSVRLTETEWTFISISSASGRGVGRSSKRRTSGLPNSLRMIAFISAGNAYPTKGGSHRPMRLKTFRTDRDTIQRPRLLKKPLFSSSLKIVASINSSALRSFALGSVSAVDVTRFSIALYGSLGGLSMKFVAYS